jgi:hypothetical protein
MENSLSATEASVKFLRDGDDLILVLSSSAVDSLGIEEGDDVTSLEMKDRTLHITLEKNRKP